MNDDSNDFPPEGMPSSEEFQKWLNADPANRAQLAAALKSFIAGEYGKLPPDVLKKCQDTLVQFQTDMAVQRTLETYQAFVDTFHIPPEEITLKERRDRCLRQLDDAIDAVLDLPEPDRTSSLRAVLAIREKMRCIKIPES